jgi:hypothetical protein
MAGRTRCVLGFWGIFAALILLASAAGPAASGFRGDAIPAITSVAEAVSGKAGACEVLECGRCSGLCTAYCDVEFEKCEKAGKRNCPRNYRSCKNGCSASLCRQCMPNQSGVTRLCYVPRRGKS